MAAEQLVGSDQSPTSSSTSAITMVNDNHSLKDMDDLDAAGPSTLSSTLQKLPNSSATPTYPKKPELQRTSSRTSTHTQNALRRMATHETGEGVALDLDGADRLDTHDEHEHEHEHSSTGSHDDHHHDEEDKHVHRDEEEAIETPLSAEDKKPRKKGKKEVQLQDQTNLLPIRQVIMVFAGLTAALFCSLLDQTIVTTALPTLGKTFGRADIVSWVGTAYLLTSTAMQPIYGRLSDIFGRKFVLLGSLVIFLIGSLACSLAQSMIQLIVFRAIQGIGGGGILTLAMIIISDVVSLKDRGKYQGITGCVVAISNSIGPILGGVFTEKVTWRWCFYINLPLTSISILIIIFLLPLKRVKGGMMEKLRKLDWYGSVLTLAWAILVLLGLSWAGSQYSWSSPAVLAPIIIGLALLGFWLYVEAKLVALPLIPLKIFRNGTVAASMATTLFNGAVFYSTLYYLPTYFQVVRGDSAIQSGVNILPLVLVQTICAFTSGILVSRTGDYFWNLTIGFAIWTIGLGLMSSTNENSSVGMIAGYQVVIGIGAGQTFQTSLIAIQAAVDRKDMATATGMRNFLRMLGGTIALAVCSTIINNTVRSRLGDVLGSELVDKVLADPTQLAELGLSDEERAAVISAYSKGISGCFYFMIPLAGLSFFLVVLFIKKIPLKRADDAEKKAEAKAWVESKKAKRHDKKGTSTRSRQASDSSAHETHKPIESPLEASGIEKNMEVAGRGMEAAAGVQPAITRIEKS